MKKILFSIVMLAVCCHASAQTAEEKAAIKAAQKEAAAQLKEGLALRDDVSTAYTTIQTEKAKGEKANQKTIGECEAEIHDKSIKAVDILTTAINSGHIQEKKLFDAYKALDEAGTHVLNPELNKAAAHEEFDTLRFARAVDAVCMGCYGTLEKGNPKDQIQNQTITINTLKMPKLMIYYAYLCIFYTETKNIPMADAALDKYASFAENYPLVADDPNVKEPQYPVSQFAFNLYYTAFTMKDVALCEKYYPMALTYEDESSHAFVVSSLPQLYHEVGDTVKWIAALQEVSRQFAGTEQGETALQNLLSIYGTDAVAMGKEADRQLAEFPNSKTANYGKGYSYFAQEKYSDAIVYFKKSVEIDPEYLEGNFMCGTTIYREALDNYYKYVDSKKFKTDAEMKAAEDKYVKSYFRDAKTYFEKCRELNPNNVDDWAGPLQNIYKNLGETDKANEMAELLK